MAFRLPTFNLSCNIWRYTSLYANPPDVVTACNLAWGKRTHGPLTLVVNTAGASAGLKGSVTGMTLLLPPLTDIQRDDIGAAAPPFSGDLVEVPAGSGRCYIVLGVDDIGKGFPNEHRAAEIVPLTGRLMLFTVNPWAAPSWPTPYP